MSTKSPSKFWKKLGLGKKGSSTQANRPPSIQSHATNSTALANNEDDHSVKSKRLSGAFPHRKQSTNSIRRLQQMTAAQPDTPHVPALPSGSNTTTTTAATTATSLSIAEPKQQPTADGSAFSALGRHVEQTHQPNHVEPSTPPLPMDPELSKQQQQQQEDTDPTFDIHVEAQPQSTILTTITTPEQQKSLAVDQQQPTTPIINNKTSSSNATKLIKPTKSASSLKKSSNQSLSQSKSRLRQPSRTNSTATTTGSTHSIPVTPSASSSSSSLQQKDASATSRLAATTSTPPPPLPSLIHPTSLNGATTDQKDQLIQQLQEALQTEQSINRVLQGQKEAITRDLDYFSLTVDELMEEREALVQKYEEEKLKSQSKEEDLNVLLEKLKMSTDNARDRSMEVDQWKAEIENIKEELALEQNELKSVLKRRDLEIISLKNELASAKEQASTLSSRLETILQENAAQQQKLETNGSHLPSSNHHQSIATGAIETPNPSPRLDAHHSLDHDQVTKVSTATWGTKKHHPSLSVSTAPPPSCHALDDELMTLTKEKERLQSDYGKIPLSGGGPTSRRRKEQLEEMLDEVDSQLSKVKQKIRRS